MSNDNCRGLGLDHRWVPGEVTGREYCSKCGIPRVPVSMSALVPVELERAKALLKRAGDALDIEKSQKIRALRFQILQFLEHNK